MALLEVQDLWFTYRGTVGGEPVLRGLSLKVQRGEMIAIEGSSGSGKSTLLYILGAMLAPDRGAVRFEDREIYAMPDLDRAEFRSRKMGFVFQQFHLLPKATVLENILLPAAYPVEKATALDGALVARARDLAAELGLRDHLDKLPNQLSGGQQQRVAIARALLRDPDLILADEPTGNLDSKNSAAIIELLRTLNSRGKTVVVITHDATIARSMQRVIRVVDGRVADSASSAQDTGRQPVASSSVEGEPLLFGASALRRVFAVSLPMAVTSLRRNLARSVLNMIGITIGIAAMLAMLTLGAFAQKRILESFEAMGVNKVAIHGWPNWQLKATDKVGVLFRSFDARRDEEGLRRVFPEIRLFSPLVSSWVQSASFGGVTFDSDLRVFGVGPEYFAITNREITLGRAMTQADVDLRSSVCLLGADIAARFFTQVSPLGQVVYIKKDEQSAYGCRVIGVMKAIRASDDWTKPNNQIVLPHTFLQSLSDDWSGRVRQLLIQVKPGSDIESMSVEIQNYFKLRYGKSGVFTVDSDDVLVAQMKKFISIFRVLMTAIAALSLLVGGIGVANMMLMSVTERLKEIGIRKAVGATSLAIRAQFLSESVVLCLIAGGLGVVLGVGAYEGILWIGSKLSNKVPFEVVLEPWALGLSFIAMVVVGTLSGWVPAFKAERLEVIEALRTE